MGCVGPGTAFFPGYGVPDLARIFDANGNGNADLIGGNVGWGCESDPFAQE